MMMRLWTAALALAGLTKAIVPTKDARGLGAAFVGEASEAEEFKLLELDGEWLLIGALEGVYNVSLHTLSAAKSIRWASSSKAHSICQMKGNSPAACRNYVRVLAKEADGSLLVCGTNAFSPMCRIYRLDLAGNYESVTELAGNGICPYDPSHNSTALYFPETGELYAGTVADFAGKDPLIHRRRLKGPATVGFGLRTERNDIKTLNEPNFVGSLSFAGATYFWLREEAVEYENCGRAVYSRVARVCKADQGGPRRHAETWTSFLKARLNCSLPGPQPFYFDQIQSISEVVLAGQAGRLVYAVFNTPDAAIRASAVCAFRLDDIASLFQNSAFKSQADPAANWLPVHNSKVPQPRPTQCSDATRQMSDEAVNFMLDNPLMEDAVPNAFPSPVLTHTPAPDRLTQIAVDAQVQTVDGERVDVIYLGTDGGRILKAINMGGSEEWIVEALQVFEPNVPVRNLLVAEGGKKEPNKLIAVSSAEVRRLDLARCSEKTECWECVGMRDPHCAWHKAQGICAAKPSGSDSWPPNLYLQNVRGVGQSPCPAFHAPAAKAHNSPRHSSLPLPPNHRIHYHGPAEGNPTATDCNCEERSQNLVGGKADGTKVASPTGESRSVEAVGGASVGASSLALAVVVSTIVAGSLGFLLGHVCASRGCLRRRKEMRRTPSSLSQTQQTHLPPLSGLALGRSVSVNAQPSPPNLQSGTIKAYESRPRPPMPPNLLHGLPDAPKMDYLEANPFATLPKDYRVKKIYL